MKKRLTTGKIILIVVLILVAAVLACGGYYFSHLKASNGQARGVISSLEDLIPGYALDAENEDPDENFTPGRDPLESFEVDGRQIVGALDIPALNLRAPVLDKDQKEAFFVTWISGSPVKGTFRLEGGYEDVFFKLAKLKPGDRVIFTDMDGVRYVYEVTTQYHLKDWAEATNDLLLCYPADDQTDFVVGCTRVM